MTVRQPEPRGEPPRTALRGLLLVPELFRASGSPSVK